LKKSLFFYTSITGDIHPGLKLVRQKERLEIQGPVCDTKTFVDARVLRGQARTQKCSQWGEKNNQVSTFDYLMSLVFKVSSIKGTFFWGFFSE